MSKKLFNISYLVLSLATSSCSTLFGDNDRRLSIKSNPSDAIVYLNGSSRGTTPIILNAPNYIYNGVDITLKKEGYVDTTISLNSKFQLVGLWNLLFPIGFLIDLATGDFVKLDQMQLNQNINLGVLPKNK
jgi:hypothetical protein